MWTATTLGAAFFQIAEHCNREQFNALIGPYPGIVVSDRWTATATSTLTSASGWSTSSGSRTPTAWASRRIRRNGFPLK